MSSVVESAVSTVVNAAGQTVDAAGNIYDEAGNIIGNIKDETPNVKGLDPLAPGFSPVVTDIADPIVEEFETGAKKVGDVIQEEVVEPLFPLPPDADPGTPPPQPAASGAGSESDPAPTVADEDADIAAQEAFKALMSRFGRRQTLLGGEGQANVFRQTLLGG